MSTVCRCSGERGIIDHWWWCAIDKMFSLFLCQIEQSDRICSDDRAVMRTLPLRLWLRRRRLPHQPQSQALAIRSITFIVEGHQSWRAPKFRCGMFRPIVGSTHRPNQPFSQPANRKVFTHEPKQPCLQPLPAEMIIHILIVNTSKIIIEIYDARIKFKTWWLISLNLKINQY